MKKFIVVIAALSAFSIPSFAQGGKSGGGAGTTSRSVAPGAPSTILNRDFNTMTKTGRKGDYLTGDVVLEGGSLPWDPIPLTVSCDGKIRYTSARTPKAIS
jgi:hypothetical protein